MMNRVTVNASKTYDVLIDRGLFSKAGDWVHELLPKAEKAALITDDHVAPLYADAVQKSLEAAGYPTVRFTLPHGEASKNAQNYVQILNFLAVNNLTRSDLIIALGGGVVGDIAGFAAATYLRGISYVQMPTTLLAMVDSSVGGKTAIDLGAGKNLAGAFCQPDLVLCDLSALDTLPEEFFVDGCAEVVKYGVLEDETLLAHLLEKGKAFDRDAVVTRCVQIKRDYVCADELDTGLRRKLNLGHTVGHAIETCSGYAVSHGRAVAMGMGIIARAAAARGDCTPQCARQILQALETMGLPTQTDYTAEELLTPMLSDKKRTGSTVSLIVPQKIARCDIVPVAVDDLADYIKMGL